MTACSSLRTQCALGVEAPPWLRCYSIGHTLSPRQQEQHPASVHHGISTNSTRSSLHAADYPCSNFAHSSSLLSTLLCPHRHSDPFNSPLNLPPPSKVHRSALRSPQTYRHCKACMSLLLRDRLREGGSLRHIRSFSTYTSTPMSKPASPPSPHLLRTPTVTLPPLLASTSPPSSNCPTTQLNSASYLSPPSQVVLPWSLYEIQISLLSTTVSIM